MKNKTLQEVYNNSSDEVKEILKTKFSEKDLGIIDIEQEIRNEILEIIKKNIKNVRFLDYDGDVSDLPSSRFEIFDEKGDWLFDICYDEEYKHFLYSGYRICMIFESKYGINYRDFNNIMKGVVEEDLKMDGVTPNRIYSRTLWKVEEDLKMDGVTPSIPFRMIPE